MAEVFCLSCGKVLTRAEYAQGRCPVCRASLARAPVSARPVPEMDDESSFRHAPARDEYDGPPRQLSPRWNTVQWGLNLMAIAVVGIIVCYGLLLLISVFVGGLAPGALGPGPALLAANLLALIPGLALLIFVVVYLVGYAMCSYAPKESRVRGLVTASLMCVLAAFMMYLVCVLLMFLTMLSLRDAEFRGRQEVLATMVGLVAIIIVAYVLYFAGWVLFVLFLRGVAKFFRNGRLARSCVYYLIATFAAIVLFILTYMLLIALIGPRGLFRGENEILVLFAIFWAVISIAMLVWYITLLVRTRNTIRSAMKQATSSQYSEF